MVFQKARSEAEKILKEKMIPEFFNLNSRLLLPGVLSSVALAVLSFVISPSPAVPVILIILLVGLGILFSWLIKAPTPRGRALMDEAEGFKMYLSVAEKDRLNLMHEPELTAERFEKLLPYAIALGVENEWGQKFENALNFLGGNKKIAPACIGPVPGAGQLLSRCRISLNVGEAFPRPYHQHLQHQAHLQAAEEDGVQVAVVAAEAVAAGKPSTYEGINIDPGCISSSLRNNKYIFYDLL